jgi:hypothetical protein
MNEILKDTNKWDDIYMYGMEALIVLKCPFYSKHSKNSTQGPKNQRN